MTNKSLIEWQKWHSTWPLLGGGQLLLFGLVGFIFSQGTLYATIRPFALAFLAVAMLEGRSKGIAALGGMLLGLFGLGFGGEYVSTMLVAVVIILVLWQNFSWLEKHWLIIPVFVGISNLFFKELFYFLPMTYSYSWSGILLESGLIGFAVWAMGTGLSSWPQLVGKGSLGIREKIGWFLLVVAFLLGIKDWYFMGFDVQSICSRLLVLLAAYGSGTSSGAMAGVLVGILPSLMGKLSTASMGFYGLAGLIGGLFKPWGKMAVWVGFLIGNLLLAINFLTGAQVLSTILETVFAGVIFAILPLAQEALVNGVECQPCLKQAGYDDAGRVKIEKIGRIFVELGEELQPESALEPEEVLLEALEGLYNRVRDQVCMDCSKSQLCWERERKQTYEEFARVCDFLEKGGCGKVGCFSSKFSHKCQQTGQLEVALRNQMDMFKQQKYFREQVKVAKETVAKQFTGIGQVVSSLANTRDYAQDAEAIILAYSGKERIPLEKIQVYEEGKKDWAVALQLPKCQGEKYCRQVLPSKVSKWLKRPYGLQSAVCANKEGRSCQLKLWPQMSYQLVVGVAVSIKKGHEVCGDSWANVPLSPGKAALMISDGMGSGQQANRQSATTVRLLERLLLSGVTQQLALEIVNAVLLLRSEEESFATVDLAIVDGIAHKIEFVKISAAPSFIKRGKQVKVYEGYSLPVGILAEVDSAHLEHRLEVGDILIMMSDGVYESHEEGILQWQEALSNLPTDEPQLVADYILAIANNRYSESPHDDMTIMVAKLISHH